MCRLSAQARKLSYVPSKLRKKIDWLFKRAEGALLPPAVLALEGAHLDPDGARLAPRACTDDVAVIGDEERLVELLDALGDAAARPAYVRKHGVCGVRRFEAGEGGRFYLPARSGGARDQSMP